MTDQFSGVAQSSTPFGPFSPRHEPMEGVHGIDPNPFVVYSPALSLQLGIQNLIAQLEDDRLV
ncbi:MAG TPA: hypothetical protein VMM58_01240 [Bacteroidota bacterium]|nr:hypothetical protein [Bacteroidota bacterium]